MSRRFCLTLNLKNNPELIRQYDEYHKKVWPEVLDSIRDSGILNMEIYRYDSRLFMIMETEDDFSFERKKELDRNNKRIQEWEALMWQFQEPIPGSAEGEKWVLMEKIFELGGIQ